VRVRRGGDGQIGAESKEGGWGAVAGRIYLEVLEVEGEGGAAVGSAAVGMAGA